MKKLLYLSFIQLNIFLIDIVHIEIFLDAIKRMNNKIKIMMT